MTYSRASEDMGVVKIGENFDDEFDREILEGSLHVWSKSLGSIGMKCKRGCSWIPQMGNSGSGGAKVALGVYVQKRK